MSANALETDAKSTDTGKEVNEPERDRPFPGAFTIRQVFQDPEREIGRAPFTADIAGGGTIRN
ncbi:hypothetical protein D3C87_1476380 [compost metagenome]